MVDVLDKDKHGTVDALCAQIDDLNNQVSVLVKVVGSSGGGGGGTNAHTRVHVPESRSYRGACDAKDLENFLFDMLQ